MKKFIAVVTVALYFVSMVACAPDNSGTDLSHPYFTGEVLEKYDKSCLVAVTDTGNGNFTVGEKVVVTTDIADCPEFAVGDFLTVSFDGKVAMSYPPQVVQVYRIRKAERPKSNDAATVSSASTGSDPNAQPTFTKQQYVSENVYIKYWLYTPENPTQNLPLIVYLHGGSGKGDDLELITAADSLPRYLQDGKLTPNAYVLVPQVSSAYKGWGNNKSDVMKLIAFVTEKYQIDEDRISLTGHSMGGSGAWMLALAYPETFCAVAPLSGSVKLTDSNINKLKNMPVWAIVGSEDTIVDPQSSVDFVSTLSMVNEAAKVTALAGADHFAVPNMSYLSKEHDLIAWLLTQAK